MLVVAILGLVIGGVVVQLEADHGGLRRVRHVINAICCVGQYVTYYL
jgi:hypothetical protein